MRILDWECVISPDGHTRAAAHKESGNVVSIDGRIIGHCDAPREVFEWLIRPQLRQAWLNGCAIGIDALCIGTPEKACAMNPYLGEPPNKDNDAS